MEKLIKRLEELKVDMSMPGDIDKWYYEGYIKAIEDAQNLVKNNGVLSVVSISLPSEEEIREPIQNALYSTDRLTTDQCTELADGILTYLTEAGYKVVRQ